MLRLTGFTRHRVFITRPVCADLLERLDCYFEIEKRDSMTPMGIDEMRTVLKEKSAVVLDCDDDFHGLAGSVPGLIAVCSVAYSYDNMDLPMLTKAGTIATHVRLDFAEQSVGVRMARAAENLIAAFGFGRIGGHPPDILNPELACAGCCM